MPCLCARRNWQSRTLIITVFIQSRPPKWMRNWLKLRPRRNRKISESKFQAWTPAAEKREINGSAIQVAVLREGLRPASCFFSSCIVERVLQILAVEDDRALAQLMALVLGGPAAKVTS